jgi:hypothetical protein
MNCHEQLEDLQRSKFLVYAWHASVWTVLLVHLLGKGLLQHDCSLLSV